MNGNQTLDENLADNDGVLMAFHVSKLSIFELFF